MTISLKAPSAFQTVTARSGNAYTSNVNAIITGVPTSGFDLDDLYTAGCIPMPLNGGLSNFTATTNPGSTNDNTQGYAIGSSWFNKNTGIEYRAEAVTTNAATWVAIGSASSLGLPFVAGRFYGIPAGSTQAAVLTVLGTLYAYPVYIPAGTTLATLSLGSTTGQTGGKGRFALFADNGAGYPGAIVAGTDSGDLAATTTAVATSGALTVALASGWYWVGSIFTASSTMPSVTGSTAIYASSLNSLIGSDTAAHALTVSAEASSGIAITGQTYPVTNMTTSFATFPASAAIQLNVTTPIAILGV